MWGGFAVILSVLVKPVCRLILKYSKNRVLLTMFVLSVNRDVNLIIGRSPISFNLVTTIITKLQRTAATCFSCKFHASDLYFDGAGYVCADNQLSRWPAVRGQTAGAKNLWIYLFLPACILDVNTHLELWPFLVKYMEPRSRVYSFR